MDIVYVLGTGSKWNDNELRYSLRSVEKYLNGYEKVFIVGEKPKWLQNIIHISYPDTHKEKETRIAKKIYQACLDERVSRDFLFINDDHFFNREVYGPSFPNYYSDTLQNEFDKKNVNMIYRSAIKNTIDLLNVYGIKNNKFFDVHYPIMYNRNSFIRLFNSINWDVEFSYVIKSLYGNMFDCIGTKVADCKIDHFYEIDFILDKIKGQNVFSVGDRGLSENMKSILETMFPEKSKYEI